MADDQADLQRALEFVISRVEAEAQRSSPLNDDEQYMLHDLPSRSAFGYARSEQEPFIPRDFVYERLCAMAKSAYHRDVSMNPSAESQWRFCAAVFKLNRHPMLWLLSWAGVEERRPWWDRWLLAGSGVLLVALFVAVILSSIHFGFGLGGKVIAALWIAGIVAIGFAIKRLERWQARQAIEMYRPR